MCSHTIGGQLRRAAMRWCLLTISSLAQQMRSGGPVCEYRHRDADREDLATASAERLGRHDSRVPDSTVLKRRPDRTLNLLGQTG